MRGHHPDPADSTVVLRTVNGHSENSKCRNRIFMIVYPYRSSAGSLENEYKTKRETI